MAIASAAASMGKKPYWLDLLSFPESDCSRIIAGQNELYSMGSRWSQKYPLFNKLVWEPMNSEGFRKLSYNAADQKTAELFAPILSSLSPETPFVSTHAWCAQAALHAGFTSVVSAVCDNWPMALHLAEGSIHTVQTRSAFLGYKVLRGMPPNWLSPDFTSALALPPPVVMSNVPSRMVSVEEAEMPSCWASIVKVPPAM